MSACDSLFSVSLPKRSAINCVNEENSALKYLIDFALFVGYRTINLGGEKSQPSGSFSADAPAYKNAKRHIRRVRERAAAAAAALPFGRIRPSGFFGSLEGTAE